LWFSALGFLFTISYHQSVNIATKKPSETVPEESFAFSLQLPADAEFMEDVFQSRIG